MLDPYEAMELAAERRMDEATKNLPDGMFRCACGRIDALDDAEPLSAHPFAMPYCRKCQEEYWAQFPAKETA